MKNLILSVLVALTLTACSRKDEPSVKASVKVDVDKDGSIERNLKKAGKEIEAGAEKAMDKLEDAGEKVKETYQDAKDKLTDDKKAEVEVKVKRD